MGHKGVTPPSTNYAALSILLGAARAAGLHHDAIDRIYQSIDPDGYEDALYDQVANLQEFDDEDADGRWTDCRNSTVSFPAEALLRFRTCTLQNSFRSQHLAC